MNTTVIDTNTTRSSHRPPASTPASRGRVLIVDDDTSLVASWTRYLDMVGFEVTGTTDPSEVVARVKDGDYDVVMADLHMPEIDGTELLRLLQQNAPDVPVVLSTGSASVESARLAVEWKAYRYLLKPVDPDEMVSTLDGAIRERRLAQEREQALVSFRAIENEARRLAQLSVSFRNALETLWIAFQPIVDRRGAIFGYEALMRTREPSLPHPGAVLDAAEQLKQLPELARLVRARSAAEFAQADSHLFLFVNVLPCDLFDESLHSEDCPLDRFAGRVVVEVTERSSVQDLKDLGPRIASLRARGLRIAVDDLGAGYAGLTSFALLRPDVAKIDMSLVRNVDTDPVKQRLIGAMVKLCDDLEIKVVAEGIETSAERDAVMSLGVHLFQGYFIGRPAAGFTGVNW